MFEENSFSVWKQAESLDCKAETRVCNMWGYLSRLIYKLFYSGILCELPEAHRVSFSERLQICPIFATCNTPSHKVGKHLVSLVTPFSINDYTVKNTSSLANKMLNLSFICEDSYMASLDKESLHTNIPFHETTRKCVDKVNSVDRIKFVDFS